MVNYRDIFGESEVIIRTNSGDIIEGTIEYEDDKVPIMFVRPHDASEPIIVVKKNIEWITTKENARRIVKQLRQSNQISFEIIEKVKKIIKPLARIMDRIDNSLCNLNRNDPRFDKLLELSMKIEGYLRRLGFNVGREGVWWKRFTQSERSTNDEKVNFNLQEIQRELENIDDAELKRMIEVSLNDLIRSQKSDENNSENEIISRSVDVSDSRSEKAEYYRNLLS